MTCIIWLQPNILSYVGGYKVWYSFWTYIYISFLYIYAMATWFIKESYLDSLLALKIYPWVFHMFVLYFDIILSILQVIEIYIISEFYLVSAWINSSSLCLGLNFLSDITDATLSFLFIYIICLCAAFYC